MKILVFLFPITLFFSFLFIKILSTDTYILLIQEDSVVEYAQALFYFISSILSFLVSIKFMKNRLNLHGVLYGVLAIGLLFISLEEISWGQRILNIASPDYFEQHNWQHEISFHNIIESHILHIIYIPVGAYGTFAWLFVWLFLSRAKTKYGHIVHFVVPDWHISSYFFFLFFIYTLLALIKMHPDDFLQSRDQEPAELLLSLGFLFFVITNYIKLRTYLATSSTPVMRGVEPLSS